MTKNLNYFTELFKQKSCISCKKLYPYSNENLIDLFQFNNNIADKNILTVLASSDQTLDLFFLGAKEIDTFDINPLTIHYFYLKKAALLADLSLREFQTFFDFDDIENNMSNSLSKKEIIYNKIENYLAGNALKFWQTLINDYGFLETFFSSTLFFHGFCPSYYKKQINYLKSEHNFEQLKKIMLDKSITFTCSNILNLAGKLNKCYDLIYLSNIIDYIDINDFQKLIKILDNKLNLNGQVISYLFNHRLFKLEQDLKNIMPDKLQYQQFDKQKKDKALIYTKRT